MSTLRTDTLQTTDSSVTVNIADLTSLINLGNPTSPSLGASLVGRAGIAVADMAGLIAAAAVVDKNQHYLMAAFHPGTFALAAPYMGSGGGEFRWDATRAKTAHNGGTIIDPTRVLPTDWTNSGQVTTWFTPAVSGTGCFVRVGDGALDVVMFGAKPDWNGTTGTNNSPMIQKAIDVSSNGGFQTTVGAVTGGFVSISRELHFWRGAYKLDQTLNCPAYFKVRGENSVLHQTNTNNDVFSGLTAYQWDVSGIHFSGGRHHAILQNDNTDVTRWIFERCTFSLSSDFSVKTFPTGGATSHLSANLTIKQCAFYKPRKVLLNYCDSAIVENCWVFVARDNFTASTAAFVNGSLTTDGYPNLYLNNMFGVPSMGVQGVNRLANVRWSDLNKGAIHAKGSRFGGEDAGMPVVYNIAVPNTVNPFISPAIYIDDCEVFAGPDTAVDSGVISLQGQVPNRITITNCSGPLSVPYICNAGSQIASFPTYFANYTAASGQPAYQQFSIKIENNSSLNPDGVVFAERIPSGLRMFVNNFRGTKLRRVGTQVLANAFANNFVSFTNLDYDNQGGWAVGNPTRLVMPAGATKMRIDAYIALDGGWTGNILELSITDSGGAIVAKQDIQSGANIQGFALSLSAVVDGSLFYQICVRQNTAGTQNLVAATVTTTALDYIN